jgi:hypothetical protein
VDLPRALAAPELVDFVEEDLDIVSTASPGVNDTWVFRLLLENLREQIPDRDDP